MKKIYRHCIAAICGIVFPMFVFAGPVDVNTADAQTLSVELQGVGLSKAQAIVADRTENGPFSSAEDLARVKGIGMRTVEINRDNILLQSSGKKPAR
jgi:competence protein ComEA